MNRFPLLTAFGLVAALGCANDLEKASQLKHFRLYGVRIDNVTRQTSDPLSAEVAPDETAHLSLRYEDPNGMGRTVSVVWLFCPQLARSGVSFGCDPRTPGFSFAMGPEVDYRVPRVDYGIDRNGRARIQAIAFACAGGTPTVSNGTPSCSGTGSESWAVTRSVIVRTSETAQMNHNPVITQVSMTRVGVANDPPIVLNPDGSTVIPRCTVTPCQEYQVEITPNPGAREVYRGFNTQGAMADLSERILFGYSGTAGEFDLGFYVDTPERPSAPPRVKWTVPGTAGPIKMVFTALDPRGGFDSVTRTITLQ